MLLALSSRKIMITEILDLKAVLGKLYFIVEL